MRQDHFPPNGRQGRGPHPEPRTPAEENPVWTWKRIGGVGGLFGGLAAIVFGSALTILSWLTRAVTAASSLRKFGTVFFLFAMPLLILGAHLLDLSERHR